MSSTASDDDATIRGDHVHFKRAVNPGQLVVSVAPTIGDNADDGDETRILQTQQVYQQRQGTATLNADHTDDRTATGDNFFTATFPISSFDSTAPPSRTTTAHTGSQIHTSSGGSSGGSIGSVSAMRNGGAWSLVAALNRLRQVPAYVWRISAWVCGCVTPPCCDAGSPRRGLEEGEVPAGFDVTGLRF